MESSSRARFESLSADEWLQRLRAMPEEDYAKDPTRNRLAVLLNRTNHTSYHLGQVILAPNSSPKQDEKDWFLHGRDPAYQYASKRMDVHKEAITIAVLNGSGKLVMESIIETKAITILEYQKLGRIGPSLDHQS